MVGTAAAGACAIAVDGPRDTAENSAATARRQAAKVPKFALIVFIGFNQGPENIPRWECDQGHHGNFEGLTKGSLTSSESLETKRLAELPDPTYLNDIRVSMFILARKGNCFQVETSNETETHLSAI